MIGDVINAKIIGTSLGRCDHGMMTFGLHLSWECYGQTFGGYALDRYDREKKEYVGFPDSIEVIAEILSVVGVSEWEDLLGKYIRFVDRGNDTIRKIGNITEDKWFDIDEFYKKSQE